MGINDGLSLLEVAFPFFDCMAQTVGCLLGWLQEAMNGVMCPWCGDMKERTLVPEDNQRQNEMVPSRKDWGEGIL